MNIEIKTNAAASHLIELQDKLADLCDTLRDELQDSILNTDVVNQLTGDTNASDWRVNVFEVELLGLQPLESGIQLKFYFEASGEQDEEKMMYGDKIEGRGTMTVHAHKLVVRGLVASLVEPPAERDGEEDAINDCEPDDDHEPEDGPDEDE